MSLGLPDGMLGVAWPSIRATFGLPLDALGLLLATFASGYVVSSALSGRVLMRFGIGLVLAASCALSGLALIGYALSPAWPSMVALGGALGLGAGTIDAALNTYAALAHGARVLNWMHAAFGLGAAVGPLLMTAVLASGLGWNVGYVIVAVTQLGLGAGYAVTRHRYVRVEAPAQSESEHGPGVALWRNPLAWISLALFFVYVGIEAAAGQWSFSLLTLSRNTPTAIAGVLVSAYWASLTLGRILFGLVVPRLSADHLLRGCMLVTVAAAAMLWLGAPFLFSLVALSVLGLALAPIFPLLIAETPGRLGTAQTAEAVGLQVAAAVLGGAALPAAVGVLAARLSLEVVGPCLVGGGLVQLLLHELLIRRVFGQRQSGKFQSSEVAIAPPGA